MLTIQGPRVWATLVLAAGFFFAYCFARTDTAVPISDDSGGSDPSRIGNLTSFASNLKGLVSSSPRAAPQDSSDSPVVGSQAGLSEPSPSDRYPLPSAPVHPVGMRAVSLASLPRTQPPAPVDATSNPNDSLPQIDSVQEAMDLKEFEFENVATQIPDWARRPSQLDDLISSGPSSQASPDAIPSMKAFPTWVDQVGELQGRDASQQKVVSRKSSIDLPQTPFDNPQAAGQGFLHQPGVKEAKLSVHRLNDVWEEKLSRLQPDAVPKKDSSSVFADSARSNGILPSSRPGRFVGDVATPKTIGARLSSRSDVPEYVNQVAESQVADRKRHFLFQPGYQPSEPPDR